MTDRQRQELVAHEAFIRRASQLGQPFMLKGSYLTRQYFAQPTERLPQDLDWLYIEPIASPEEAKQVFDDWAIRATEAVYDDGVVFQSFREDAFWRMIDYAMADDFPTINTDLRYQIAGQPTQILHLDISFNLPLDIPSEPLLYQPLQGEPFVVEHTAPLGLQVAWKLHQTLVRPRFKDLFDLQYLVQHPDFTTITQQQALAALRQECRADNTDVARLRWLLAGDLVPLFSTEPIATAWQFWRFGPSSPQYPIHYYECATAITDATQLPVNLSNFQLRLALVLQQAGFTPDQLPVPGASHRSAEQLSTTKRRFFDGLRDLFT